MKDLCVILPVVVFEIYLLIVANRFSKKLVSDDWYDNPFLVITSLIHFFGGLLFLAQSVYLSLKLVHYLKAELYISAVYTLIVMIVGILLCALLMSNAVSMCKKTLI